MDIPVLLVVDLGDVLDVDADVHDGQRLVGQVELGVVARDADRLTLGANAAAVPVGGNESLVAWKELTDILVLDQDIFLYSKMVFR